MAQALLRAALGTLFLFFMTSLGAALVFFLPGEPCPRLQRVLLGFAAGVMTAASVWSLLLPAMARAAELGSCPAWLCASAGTLAGAASLAVLDSLLPHLHREGQRGQTLLVTAITLHNIPEGMAVGLAFALAGAGETLAGAAALALGVGVQNFPEGAAIALPLRQAGKSRGCAFLAGMLSGIVEPVFGTAVVLVAAGAAERMPWLLSFAAGAMLYAAVEELIPRAHSRGGTCGFVAGFLLMMALDTAFG